MPFKNVRRVETISVLNGMKFVYLFNCFFSNMRIVREKK